MLRNSALLIKLIARRANESRNPKKSTVKLFGALYLNIIIPPKCRTRNAIQMAKSFPRRHLIRLTPVLGFSHARKSSCADLEYQEK
jgi:hypothetical protein